MQSHARFFALAALCMAVSPASAQSYQAELGPMPLDDETKEFIAGRGKVTADFAGGMLTVAGRFAGMPSNATEANIFLSPHIGVPGTRVLALTVTKSGSGDLAGRFRLTTAQAKALRTGNLYVQVNSEKAPPGYSWGPKGTLWGWLLPAHETVGANVPQQGKWFIPQLDTPKR